MSYHAIYKCRQCGVTVHGNGHTSLKNMKTLLVEAADDRLGLSSIAGAICFERFMVHNCDQHRTTGYPKRQGLCDLVGMEADVAGD